MQDIGVTTSERPSTASVQSVRPPLLSIVVPTFNETENLRELVRRLEAWLTGYDWEVVFVDDDSTDGSTSTLFSLAQSNPRVRFLHRIGRRGLSSAVIEGILSTSAPYVAVMDADLQHDENCLLPMIEALRTSDCAICWKVASMAGTPRGRRSASRQQRLRKCSCMSARPTP